MNNQIRFFNITNLFRRRPDAVAIVNGSRHYPSVSGTVRFYGTPAGVIVRADIDGLPVGAGKCDSPVFGFHIHSGMACRGNATDPFADAMGHFNPDDCMHPYHAGDLPPLFGADGRALSVFLTNRFRVRDVIGRSVIIHAMPDDFHSQPAGNSGEKIACGIIAGSRR